ncbi:MAG: starch-binding protein [Ruminococcus sp.]|nr:starch-binding protein [Ruminococcus sp.]
MKRSKRLLSLLLAVMLILTTVVSTTIVSTSAAGIDNSALVSDYYATNPNGQVGKQGSITIDGSFSDWTQDMLIAKGAAWDVANHYKGAHENCLLDTTALFAAWDSSNLYIGWQMVNTTDTWHREGDGSLSDGGRVLDVPLIVALRVDPSKTPMSNKNNTGGPIWGQKMGLTFETPVDHLLYMSGKPGLGTPALFTAVDAEGNTDYGAGCKNFTSAGIEYKMAEGNIMDTIMGLNYSEDPSDVTNPDADWVDYKTFTGSMGAHKTSYDSFYEIKIPLSVLGIDANYLTTNGIGAMVVATRGESALDCIPFDTTMLDNAMGEYGSDPSTSHEKDDEDVITVDLACIGKGGVVNPPVDIETEPTTTAPVVTTAPTQPTTVKPVVTEPSEAITTATTPTEEPSDPIVIPPVVTTVATEPSEVTTAAAPTVPVPTLDFGDDTTPTETTKDAETTVTAPIVVPTAGILGDADENDNVNIKDATSIQKHIAKITTLGENAQFLADVDANEVLNIRDATNIQKWIAKMPVDYAIGEPVQDNEIIIPVPTEPTTEATEVTTDVPPVIVEPTTEATEATTVTIVPTTAEPVVTEPTTVEPVVTEPTTAEPVVTEPIVTEPIITEPIVTEPIVTEPINPPDDGTETIYFVDGTPEGWIKDAGARIYIYDYEGMQSYEGTTSDSVTWAFQVPAGLTSINFYRCEGEFTQTAWNSWTMCVTVRGSENTFTATGNEAGSWSGNGGGGYNPPVDNPPIDNPPADGDYIYFTDNQGWGTVYCHSWNMVGGTTEWPGVQMENVGGNQYRVVVDSTHTNLKFNGGLGGPESGEFELVIGNTYSN